MLNNGITDLQIGRGKKRTYDDSINSSNVIQKYRKHEDTAGVIKKIRLENFMNHGELEWEPHANVHFVTGINVFVLNQQINRANNKF